jgi:GTP1/Obg family GTP-binding protein
MGIYPELNQQFSILSASKKDQFELFKSVKISFNKNPNRWSMGGFDLRILQFLSEQIHSNLENLLGEVPKTNMISSFINDIENSLAESEFYRAIKTDITEFEQAFAKLKNEMIVSRKAMIDILQKIK